MDTNNGEVDQKIEEDIANDEPSDIAFHLKETQLVVALLVEHDVKKSTGIDRYLIEGFNPVGEQTLVWSNPNEDTQINQ